MDENRRLTYLNAMGIDLYPPPNSPALKKTTETIENIENVENVENVENIGNVENRVIAPSTMTDEGEFTRQSKPVSANPDSQNASSSMTEQSLNLNLGTVSTDTKTHEQKHPANTEIPSAKLSEPLPSGSEESSDHEEFRFSLQFYRISDRLAVINEAPYLDSGNQDSAIQILLLNIVKALEINLEQLNQPRVFRWPLAEDDDAGIARMPEALLTLGGFMRKQLESQTTAYLLIFATQCKALFEQRENETSVLQDSDVRVITTHSLNAMLQVPSLKRSVWQDIQDLRGKVSD